jgi:glycerophosphoryl diester phosphodiesterase
MIRKTFIRISLGLGFIAASLYVWNASWWGAPQTYALDIQAHRGLHQSFSRDGLTRDSCTAARIDTPTHDYIENTLPSMRAALDYGASQIEIDIHPTIDGEFAVFHDWGLACRTNGVGPVRDLSWAQLKDLDIGYGYTADGGISFPFRGQFIGVMPRLSDVLNNFPETRFAVNIKSRSRKEAQLLMRYLEAMDITRLDFIGHHAPMKEIKTIKPEARVMSRQSAKACLLSYMALGWSGYVPKPCHNMTVPVPVNYRRLLWGWPYKFETRLNKRASRSLLIGPLSHAGTAGLDSPEDLKWVPKHYSGIVFTNKAEIIGPILKPLK